MPASTIAAFSVVNEFEAALQQVGSVELLVTGQGQFRAQLIRIALPHLSLLRGEERLSRLAVLLVAPDSALIILPVQREPSQIWSGANLLPGEIITVSGGEWLHVRSDGPCGWAAICVSAKELIRLGRALIGPEFGWQAGIHHWHPARASLRSLMGLFNGAMRLTTSQPSLPTEAQTARGLEQEVIRALIDCLSTGGGRAHRRATHRHAAIMAQLENVLRAQGNRIPAVSEVSAALRISQRTLRTCCNEYLGVGPNRYFHLRRLQRIHNALIVADPHSASVSLLAKCYGFNELGRFAMAYRKQFGELPSVTLRRSKSAGWQP
jgi:AraC-like DNA-binding protein